MSAVRVFTATLSDTRTAETDLSGRALGELLRAGSCAPERHAILPDDPETLRAFLVSAVAEGAEVCVLNGGTGLAPRDQTCETLEALFDKRLEGFGERFRQLSWAQVGARAMLSRATAGLFGRCLVFSLPGSPAAVELGVRELILPILEHAVALAQGRAHGHAK